MPELVEGQIYVVENGTLKLIGVAPESNSVVSNDDGDGSGDGTDPGNGGPH